MLYGTYDPESVIVQVGTITVEGFAEGTFVTVKRNEQGFTLKVGSDGRGTRTRNANKSGTMEIVLDASSPSNDLLQEMAQTDEDEGDGVETASIKDASSQAGRAFMQNAWVQKQPDLERAKELGTVTWTIESEFVKITNSGTVPIAGTV